MALVDDFGSDFWKLCLQKEKQKFGLSILNYPLRTDRFEWINHCFGAYSAPPFLEQRKKCAVYMEECNIEIFNMQNLVSMLNY